MLEPLTVRRIADIRHRDLRRPPQRSRLQLTARSREPGPWDHTVLSDSEGAIARGPAVEAFHLDRITVAV